jgi:hypothetical protein
VTGIRSCVRFAQYRSRSTGCRNRCSHPQAVATLSSVNWIAIAAFTAAGLSLVNVGVSYRLNSRSHLEQWRRDEERPIVARMLTLSADTLGEWWAAGNARRDWIESVNADPSRVSEDVKARREASERWRAGSEKYDKLRFELAQLDLIAGRPLRDVADALLREHESVRQWIGPASGASDWFKLLAEHNNKIVGLHGDLIRQTRADLGVDRTLVRHRLLKNLP